MKRRTSWDLEELVKRVAEWRQEEGGRGSRIPDGLWQDAVRASRAVGVWATAKALHFNYQALRRRADEAAVGERALGGSARRARQTSGAGEASDGRTGRWGGASQRGPDESHRRGAGEGEGGARLHRAEDGADRWRENDGCRSGESSWRSDAVRGVRRCGHPGPGADAVEPATMMQLTPQMQIMVAVEPVDFRRGIDGLARLCRDSLATDPFSGAIFVFRSRRGSAIKILAYDGQGFWLCQKRLSQGRFRYWPSSGGAVKRELLAHQLQVLLAGGDPGATRAVPAWRPITPATLATAGI